MVWTKLAYLRFPDCIRPQLVNGQWRGAEVGARYRNALRKEFLKAGVPWEFDKVQATSRHPYDRPPKHTKDQREKAARIQKINKALQNQEALITKYRQAYLNSKRLTGVDYMIRNALGVYIKTGKAKNVE